MGDINNTEFNAPSREAIVKKIMQIRRILYNFEDFLERDTPFRNRNETNSSTFSKQKYSTEGLNFN